MDTEDSARLLIDELTKDIATYRELYLLTLALLHKATVRGDSLKFALERVLQQDRELGFR